jgi:hypothetical protein
MVCEYVKANPSDFTKPYKLFEKEINRYFYKINKVYSNPKVALSLDKNTLDMEILNAFRQWANVFNNFNEPYIGIRRKSYDWEFLNLPLTQALLDEGVIIVNKYNKRVHAEQYISYHFMSLVEKYLKKNKVNSLYRRLRMTYYNIIKGFKFSTNFYVMGQKKYLLIPIEGPTLPENEFIYGLNLKWDVPIELYKSKTHESYWTMDGTKLGNVH